MKLKLRAAIVVCAFLSFSAIFLTIHQFPALPDLNTLRKMKPISELRVQESFEMPHIYTVRKRFSKSGNSSPEFVQNNENIKNETDDLNVQSEVTGEKSDNYWLQLSKRMDQGKSENVSNKDTNEYIEELLEKLQTANGLKFNFQKTRLLSYQDFLKIQRNRARRKGKGLPIYATYNGG